MTNAATSTFISKLSDFKSLRREVKDIEIRYLPSGVISFDVLSGGGFPYGSVTELGGQNRHGKTLLSLITAGYTIKHGGNVAYVYMEQGNVDYEWAKQFRADLTGEHFAYLTPDDGTEACDDVLNLVKQSSDLNLKLIIIDSLVCLFPSSEQMKEMNQNDQMGANAKLLSVFLRRLGPILRNYGRDVAIIGINQVRQGGVGKAMYYGPEHIMPGGEAKDHQMFLRAMMHKPQPIKSKSPARVIGYTHRGKILKNKSHELSEDEFQFDVLSEPDIFHDWSPALLKYGIQYGIFTNDSGAVYSGSGKCHFRGELLGAKQEDVRSTLYQNDELAERVYQAIWEKI